MNAFVKKEIRLLLPNAAVCCALGLANFTFTFNNDGSLRYVWGFLLSFVFCGGVAVMLALNSFGAEISAGTFSSLLAQPVPRQKIWNTKVLLLAATLLFVAVFWSACGVVRLAMLGRNLGLLDLCSGLGIFGLAIFSGGLWTVLLLRQVAAAFWFTVLVPSVLLVVFSGLFDDGQADGHFTTGILACVFGAYSLAGFFLARWLFFRAQDVQWSGGVIAMPEMRGRAEIKSALAGARRQWRPHAALWWKELQLHQAQFIFAGALLVLHLGVLVTRHFGHFQKNSSTEFILEMFWGLWLVLPLLTGAAAVAEERKLGTLAAQLCLPVRRRTQFALKFRVTLMLSVLFGAILPVLLEGRRILPAFHFLPSGMSSDALALAHSGTLAGLFWFALEITNILAPLLLLIGLALAIGAIAFYASSLARNTLQALAPAVAGLALFLFLVFTAAMPPPMFNFFFGRATGSFVPWHGALIYLTGLPAFFSALVALAFWNSRQTAPGFAAARRNLLVFAAVFAATVFATSAVYHRAWERLTPFEPAHGAARLANTRPPVLENYLNYFTVRLADGRIWADTFALNVNHNRPLDFFLGNIRLESFGQNDFYTGSNWVSLVRCWRGELAGLKTDGSLWVSSRPTTLAWFGGGRFDISKAGDLVQLGRETGWGSLIQYGNSLLLVKQDGSLWRLGLAEKDWNHVDWKKWPGLHTFAPVQIGTRTNWAEVFRRNDRGYLRKTDGSVWSCWVESNYPWPVEEIDLGFKIQRQPCLETAGERSTTDIWSGTRYGLAVRNDGTFRISTEQQLIKKSNYYAPTPVDYQFGRETNWLAVAAASYSHNVVTLKNDGTLWVWDFNHDDRRGWDLGRDESEMLAVRPAQLGAHTDWLAIAGAPGGVVSLAADGSLWYWPLETAGALASNLIGRNYRDDGSDTSWIEPLLDISREPQFLGHVFGEPAAR